MKWHRGTDRHREQRQKQSHDAHFWPAGAYAHPNAVVIPSKNSAYVKSQMDLHTLRTGVHDQDRLLQHSVQQDSSDIHVPLALDQFYYTSLSGNDRQNMDQVLYRHQERTLISVKPDDRLICMVDQFWLY